MSVGMYKKWELILKTLTLFGLVVAAFWAYFTYTDTKRQEFYSHYWNTKFELYLETSKAAAGMATTNSQEEFNIHRQKYWNLFYGPLSLVEGESVKIAMQKFSAIVPKEDVGSGSALPFSKMKQPAYQLTLALKNELGKSWKNPFSELSE